MRRLMSCAAIALTTLVLPALPAQALPAETSPVTCEIGLQGQRFGSELIASISTVCNLPVQALSVGPMIAYTGGVEFARISGSLCSLCNEVVARTSFPCTGTCLGDWKLSGRHFIEGALWIKDFGGMGIEVATVDTEPASAPCGPADGPNITSVSRMLTIACSTFAIGS